MLKVRPLDVPGLLEIIPRRIADGRGFFSETWRRDRYAAHGVDVDFVQDNHSLTNDVGAVRGLHYQEPPAAQAKLVRVTRGAVWDVAVDLRSGSPTRGRWAALSLSAEEGNQLFVPPGFAHGFQVTAPDTEVQYKVSAAYDPSLDRAIRWDDPDIGIAWPLPVDPDLLSVRDREAPALVETETVF